MKLLRPYLVTPVLFGSALLLGTRLAGARTVQAEWYVRGPTSGADVKHLEESVCQLPSVSYCKVSEATIEIRFDDQKLTEPELRAAVAQAGDQLAQRVQPE